MSDKKKPRIAILVGSKGRGSNMATLIASCLSGDVPAEPVLVVSPKEATPATIRAQSLGVTVATIERDEQYETRLAHALDDAQIDVICLAGYMWLLPAAIVSSFKGRILNVHPALLPKFGGKGMYGHHVHEAVIAAGEKESGCTVHFVTEHYDEGAIILQKKCAVLPEDSPDSLADRVLDLEHQAYPEALRMVVASL